MCPAGKDEIANVDGLVGRLEHGGQAAAQLEEVEKGDAPGGVGRQAVCRHTGHPGREDVVVGEERILGVPVGLDRVGGHRGQVGHGGVAEFPERRGREIDHVLLRLAQPDTVPDHGRDKPDPAEAAQDLGLQRPRLFVLVYLPLAHFPEGVLVYTEERDHFVLPAREDLYPVIDDSLKAEEIAHGVWKRQRYEGGIVERDNM